MSKSIRYYDYLNEYIDFQRYYSDDVPSYRCTYYNIALNDSVLEGYGDGHITAGGSYRVIGELSGYRWVKILDFPVFGSEQTNPNYSAEQERVVENLTTSIVFPSSYGVYPSVHDMVFFPDGTMRDERIWPLYEVQNIEESNFGNTIFFKVTLRVSYSDICKLDLQVARELQFIEQEKKIYPSEVGDILTNSSNKIDEITKKFYNECFDHKRGLINTIIS